MNNYELHQKAQELADTFSPYQLARRLLIVQDEIIQQEVWNQRLDNELQDKALTEDGVLADCYWHCCDMITPYLGDEVGKYTLINSVGQSLEFLIKQWEEKAVLEDKLEDLENKLKRESRNA